MSLRAKDNVESPKVALLTFVYPQAEDFYRDTMKAFVAQSYSEIDMIVVNDRVEGIELPPSIEVIENDQGLGLIALREHIFNLMLERDYDLLINIDPDDTMSSDRVDAVVKAWQKTPDAAFYYSKLHYMREPEKAFFAELPERLEKVNDILPHNYVGLSHLSINMRMLKERDFHFSFPNDLVALDWYMVTEFLSLSLHGCCDDGIVYYRIYGENTAGEIKSISRERYQRAVGVKRKHYEAIKSFDLSKDDLWFVENECDRLTSIENALASGCEYDLDAVNKLLEQNTHNYWWANI